MTKAHEVNTISSSMLRNLMLVGLLALGCACGEGIKVRPKAFRHVCQDALAEMGEAANPTNLQQQLIAPGMRIYIVFAINVLNNTSSFANRVLLALFAATATYHSRLGLQVVVEDYVHAKGVKLVTLLLLNFVHAVLGAAMLMAIVRLSLGGAA